MKRSLVIAAAVALALPAIAPAYGANVVSLDVGESGGIICSDKIFLLVDSHGMFNNLFGRPEGGDGRERVDQIILKVEAIDPFEGLRPENLIKTMMPVEKMAVVHEGVGEVLRPGGGSGSLTDTAFKDKILGHIGYSSMQIGAVNYIGSNRMSEERGV